MFPLIPYRNKIYLIFKNVWMRDGNRLVGTDCSILNKKVQDFSEVVWRRRNACTIQVQRTAFVRYFLLLVS